VEWLPLIVSNLMSQCGWKNTRALGLRAMLLAGWMLVSLSPLRAQEVAGVSSSIESSGLPDAPGFEGQAAQTAPAKTEDGPQQTKRIAGIMPNFRSVSRDTILPPQSPKDKLVIAGKDTFDYSSFIIVAIQAGIAMNGKSTPEFHQGALGYGRYYWHTLADTADENFMVGGLGPVLFHQDNRFYTLGHGGVLKRIPYAMSRILISRKDDGHESFNFAEVIGAGAAAGLSSTYYPTVDRSWTKTGQKWLTGMIIDSANFVLKEYWPDINQKLRRKKKD